MGFHGGTAARAADRHRHVGMAAVAVVAGGLGAFAAPWWTWVVVSAGLLPTFAVLRRMTPADVVTRCSA
ncbi:hypothetical protein [Saccharothrix yanglingensis]|uniref:Uncharacterized protein n=1 Tax=Saccharothrix yanglingensis TaxID=659496 RepID=A0ABU0X806_9PSEU|nr:hypothetical protein [Saccharothrix yanglingensis]MDQ2587838.1 hypothetical protein [Saccharothrix yanglingensis]